MPRIALGVAYRGQAYLGWQSQPGGRTVQDRLERALSQFADEPIRTLCAGRTDAGVHALNQVVHFDTTRMRDPFSWVRGVNRYLPADIAVQWSAEPGPDFHARNHAHKDSGRKNVVHFPVPHRAFVLVRRTAVRRRTAQVAAISFRVSSSTSLGFALPFEAFMTAPLLS